MRQQIVRLTERPDLAPVVARWLWDAFGRDHGETLAMSEERVAACTADIGPQQSFVLLVDDLPVGTAGFVLQDLDERPDLSPWLAGVYVTPEWRGRGLVKLLVGEVEAAAQRAGIPTLWLYTSTAEHIYRRAGWTTDELLPPVRVAGRRSCDATFRPTLKPTPPRSGSVAPSACRGP